MRQGGARGCPTSFGADEDGVLLPLLQPVTWAGRVVMVGE
jgi:hypothetical protein